MSIQRNILHYYVDLLRMRDSEQQNAVKSESCVGALYNVIKTMKISRHAKVCGEDFSRLDFGNIPFNGIYFSLSGEYPCSFSGCKLNEWNFRSGHSLNVTSIACSKDGKMLYSASLDNNIISWDIEKGLMLSKIDNTMTMCSKGKFPHTEGHFSDSVHSMALSPDEKYIITGSDDGIARIWDLETKECIRELEGHKKLIVTVAFSPDGKYCMTGSYDSTARVWEIETGRCIQILSAGRFGDDLVEGVHFPKDEKDQFSNYNYFLSVAFSPDGKYYFTGSQSKYATIWDATSGTPIQSLKGHNGSINAVAFSIDGKYCLTGSADKTTKLWLTETGQCLLTMIGHTREVSSVAFSHDTKYCLTGSSDNTARIWNIETGECCWELKGHKGTVCAAIYSPDGKNCITSSQDKTIRVWDSKTGECIQILRDNTNRISSFAFSKDSNYYIAGMYDGIVKLNETASGKCLALLDGHTNRIDTVCISNDYKYCMTGSDYDNSAKLWDFKTGKCLNTITCLNDLKDHGFAASCITFSPNGKYCLTASWWTDQINLWEMETGKKLYSLDGHLGDVTYAVFSPDSKFFITCSRDKTAKLWNRETGNCLLTLGNHPHYVFAADFLPDAQHCVTLSYTVLKLWSLKNGNCLWTKKIGLMVKADELAVSSDGQKVFLYSNQPAHSIAKIMATEDGGYIHSLKSPSFEHIWCLPFCISQYSKGRTSYNIFKFKCSPSQSSQTPSFIDTIHAVKDLYIWKCNFHGVNADQLSVKIIHQYGGCVDEEDRRLL